MADYTDFENAYILRNLHKSNAEIAAAFIGSDGKSYRTPKAIENQRYRLLANKKASELAKSGRVERIVIPEPTKPQFVDQMTLDDDNALFLSDVHLPMQDKEFIENACNVALSWGIRNVILMGDLFDVGAFSKFVGNPVDTFDIELELAESFIQPLTDAFANVFLFLGNHEARFFKQVVRQVGVKRFGKMFASQPNFHISSYEWMEMTNKGHDFPVAAIHPKNHSQIPGNVARTLADRRFTTHHVLTGHEHTIAFTRSSDNRRHAIAVGMSGDPLRCDYGQKQVSTMPRMMQGAVLWNQGFPYPFTPYMDMAAVQRMYAPLADAA